MSERIYGQSAANRGKLEDPTRCVEEVWGNSRSDSFLSWQCSFKRGHGKEGLYCKKHAKKYE